MKTKAVKYLDYELICVDFYDPFHVLVAYNGLLMVICEFPLLVLQIQMETQDL